MKIHVDDKFHGKNSDFVDSVFVKTCDELVKGDSSNQHPKQRKKSHRSQFHSFKRSP